MLKKIRLLTPGPTPLPDRIRLAMAKDMVHHRKDEFKAILDAIQPKLQALFGTKERVLPLASSGTGAMNAAVLNLFEPGDTILIVEAGKFAERWRNIAESRELNIVSIKVTWGETISQEALKEAIANNPEAKGVLVQISETSTGVQHDIEKIAAVTRETPILLVADGVSSVGISPVEMDNWGIDCLVSGSQKGLMVPPGLSMIAFSPRAWKRVCEVKSPCFYFDLKKEFDMQEKGETHFTPAINLIYGLNESISMIEENGGFEAVFRRQYAMTMMVRTAVKALGLELFAKDNYTWGVTSVILPAGVDGAKLLKLMTENYGIIAEGGQDHLKGKIIRMGHMGWVDWADLMAGLFALAACLPLAGGFVSNRDYLEQAMNAYNQALNA